MPTRPLKRVDVFMLTGVGRVMRMMLKLSYCQPNAYMLAYLAAVSCSFPFQRYHLSSLLLLSPVTHITRLRSASTRPNSRVPSSSRRVQSCSRPPQQVSAPHRYSSVNATDSSPKKFTCNASLFLVKQWASSISICY